jgi:hypothetical protein
MDFEQLDWPVLDRLRRTFLAGSFDRAPYWQGPRDLAQYDATYGERIGWKWDAVVAELQGRGWKLPAGADTLVDWGCGSGIAGRRILEAFPGIRRAIVSDLSPAAMAFAADRLRSAHPGIEVAAMSPGQLDALAGRIVLVASHVLNELPAEARTGLLALAARAEAVLWVEPGTPPLGRELQTLRRRFLPTHDVVAPCTHQGACGLLAPGREDDWCHHFASPPSGVFADGNWKRFAERAGIDLRALPYSFLVLQRREPGAEPRPDGGWERVLGRPRVFKPEARLHSCGIGGVAEVVVSKRTLPELYKTCKREELPPVIRWRREGDAIVSVDTE